MQTINQIPPCTHLQFFILETIRLNPAKEGMLIRDMLKEVGENREPSAFYQLMKRLETQGWITSEKTKTGRIQKKFYQITASGIAAYNDTLAFYKNRKPM